MAFAFWVVAGLWLAAWFGTWFLQIALWLLALALRIAAWIATVVIGLAGLLFLALFDRPGLRKALAAPVPDR